MRVDDLMREEKLKEKYRVRFYSVITAGIAFVVALGMWGFPQYNVWERGLAGKAELMQAEWNRQIKVQEAKAAEESAKLLAQAEVERAKGVAEANKIIGHSLEGNESYLRYLWIHGLQEGKNEVIYVPTEANLPLLESTRHAAKHWGKAE